MSSVSESLVTTLTVSSFPGLCQLCCRVDLCNSVPTEVLVNSFSVSQSLGKLCNRGEISLKALVLQESVAQHVVRND